MQHALQNIVNESKSIVFFGGAGVSTESGIPDFRGAEGLYTQKGAVPPEVIISHDFFMQQTDAFYDFYKQNMVFLEAQPNPAHLKLAQWEQEGKLKAILTQNIDGLHQKAGSKTVVELHGSVHQNTCIQCGKHYDVAYIMQASGTPHCNCGGVVKPDVTLYGEMLPDGAYERAVQYVKEADLLIVGGTSLSVYPAAGLVEHFTGNHLVVVNKSKTSADDRATLVVREPIGKVFQMLN